MSEHQHLHLRYKNQTSRERHWTIHALAIYKFLKGLVLIALGVKLLTLLNRDVAEWFSDFVTRHHISPENHYAHLIIERLAGVNNQKLVAFSVGSFLLAALELTEGIGLWLEKRWAEFLTVIATALFVPVELYEVVSHFTLIRLLILIANLFVVWYLATRLRDEKKEMIEEKATKVSTTAT